jgi:SAM-dependent methyltransferase
MNHVNGRVLDIGCGAGRHSLYLQKNGFDVVGIDNSPLAIKVCKLRGLKKAKEMSINNLDFPPNHFDTIVMMGNNFGLFANRKKAKKLLKFFFKITTDNAQIIANTRDPYKTDNPDHLEYHQANKEKGRMGGQVKIRIRFAKYIGRWFDYLMVSKKEMEQILEGTGWKVKEFLDFDKASKQDIGYIAIIHKMDK